MPAPTSSADFDRAYRGPVTLWGDFRIPPELKALSVQGSPRRALELGCGLGRFSRYLAQQGLRVTGVDFSEVAIARARERPVHDVQPPEFIVGDVTKLDALRGPYDFSYDVGCFHCLGHDAQHAYAAEVFRLLKPGGVHLIWAIDSSPSDIEFSPEVVAQAFAQGFTLQDSRLSRRRFIRSHWYWLLRAAS
jgi:cyclopropane fatty-acyl-phospholipid synthase-like methyltransferase